MLQQRLLVGGGVFILNASPSDGNNYDFLTDKVSYHFTIHCSGTRNTSSGFRRYIKVDALARRLQL
jgi:hypothetical protein